MLLFSVNRVQLPHPRRSVLLKTPGCIILYLCPFFFLKNTFHTVFPIVNSHK
uniref:Uncharacterized protein n=1 Tax=Anguilla anguilla TaxID=7936 RepID=A0A0E9VUN4_ANGAN